MNIDARKTIHFHYTNHRGERSWRTVVPEHMWWGVTAWHPQEGWLLRAFDMDKREYRDFAWSGIHGVETRQDILKNQNVAIEPPTRDRVADRPLLDRCIAAFEFHEWLLANGYADVAREFNQRGLCDGKLL